MAAPASEFRILIADDHADSVESLADLLHLDLGCQVLTAEDGRQAVQQALAHRPDVVILDLEMPFMSGIEAARQIRTISSADPPLLLAVTGKGLSAQELATIDRHFDRAFAKPPDLDRLLAVLREHIAQAPVRNRSGGFELSEVVTMAVREVGPSISAKGLTFSFDYEGPSRLVQGDASSLQQSLRRMLNGAMAALDEGALIFTGEATVQADGDIRLVVNAAGTGRLAPAAELTRLLELMSLAEPAGTVSAAEARTAVGHCNHTGARIDYASLTTEGVLFRTELSFQPSGQATEEVETRVDGTRAWLVGDDDMPTAALQRRLQRLGWRTTRFTHCAQALSVLDAAPARPPELLIVTEGEDTCTEVLREFLAYSIPGSQRIFAVAADSAVLQAEQAVTGFELRVYPLSPLELREFAQRLAPGAGTTDQGGALTTSASLADRPLVLIVDDNEVNRIVAGGLLRALGYEVIVAHDGLDAISQCKRTPPNLVLMDIDMPVVNGLDATSRIRELQSQGRIAPFGIVAATANGTRSAREDCLAVGMDGYILKPLLLATLRDELNRVMSLARGH